MSTYKTKDGSDRVIPGVGRTTKGQITTDVEIESPLFELVTIPELVAPVNQPVTPSHITETPIDTTSQAVPQQTTKENEQ